MPIHSISSPLDKIYKIIQCKKYVISIITFFFLFFKQKYKRVPAQIVAEIYQSNPLM